MGNILVFNTGSSSLKFAVFGPDLGAKHSGEVTGIGDLSKLKINGTVRKVNISDHKSALEMLLNELISLNVSTDKLAAVGHRVVHGGRLFAAPEIISDEVLAKIDMCSDLAPLHNPNALHVIRSLKSLAPELLQTASFDTAFHTTIPEVAKRYAIPDEFYQQGIQRYGFHGLSYASLVESLRPDLPDRLLAFHLGNGASICAIKSGKSVATTMGYSPLEGLTMGTRSGSVDPTVALQIARSRGVDKAEEILNAESGLFALAGTNNMVELTAREDHRAEFAVDHFCYWAARHAGAMCVAMGGVDAFAFTGGIGENASDIRGKIVQHLAFIGPKPLHVIEAKEEHQIAKDARALLGNLNSP